MASMMMVDSLKQMMTCTVCLEEKTDQKMLPCQHTLCISCLNGVCANKSSLECPVCKKSHAVPNGGILSYPNSIICNQLADILKQDGGMPADITDGPDVQPKVDDSSVGEKNHQRKLATELQAEIDIAKCKLRSGEIEFRQQKASLESLNCEEANSKKKLNDLVEGMEKYKNDREETIKFLMKDSEAARVQHAEEFSKYERDLNEMRLKLKVQSEGLGQVLSLVEKKEELDESNKVLLLSLIMNPKDDFCDLNQHRTTPAQYRLRPNTLFIELREKVRSDVCYNSYKQWDFKQSFSRVFPARPSNTYRESQLLQVLVAATPHPKKIRLINETGHELLVCCGSDRVFLIQDVGYRESNYELDRLPRAEILENVFKVGERVRLRRDLEYILELYKPLTESSIGIVVSCTGSTVVINFPEIENWTGDSEIFEFDTPIKPYDVAIVNCDDYDTQDIKFKGQWVRVGDEGAEYFPNQTLFKTFPDVISVSYRRPEHRRNKGQAVYTVETMKVRKEHLRVPMKRIDIPPNEVPVIETIMHRRTR